MAGQSRIEGQPRVAASVFSPAPRRFPHHSYTHSFDAASCLSEDCGAHLTILQHIFRIIVRTRPAWNADQPYCPWTVILG